MTAYRLDNLYVDYKIINTIQIHIHIHIPYDHILTNKICDSLQKDVWNPKDESKY